MAYNAENYKRIAAQFKDKSIRAQQAADARKEELHQRLPQIAEIDRALATTGLRIMREALNGKEGLQERVRRLEEGNNLLLEARAEILRASGYPEDYSDVHYECNECMDTGFLNGKMCKCLRTALNYAGYESSGVLKLIEKQNFETFDLKYYEGNERRNMENIFHRALTYAASFNGQTMKNLLFMGTTGLGKTHLSSAIAKVVIDNGYDVLYESAQQIFADFEAERFGRVPHGENRTSRYFECDLLIIDDLGTEMPGQFTTAALYSLVNDRLLAGKPMIVSTNLNIDEISKRYSPQIASRLQGSFQLLPFVGEDIRILKNK